MVGIIKPLGNFLFLLNDRIRLIGGATALFAVHCELCITYAKSARALGCAESNYRDFVQGKRSYSLGFLKKFCNVFGPSNLLEIIFNQDLLFTARSVRVSLPKKLNVDFAYFLGYLYGDGYVCSDGKRIEFVDEDRCQIEAVGRIAKRLFMVEPRIYERWNENSKKPVFKLTLSCRPLNDYLSAVFGIKKGVKEGLSIPKQVLENMELLRWYLRGLFDADGTLPKNPEKAKQLFIDIALKDLSFINQIKVALETFGVTTLAPYARHSFSPATGRPCVTWELRIRRKGQIVRFLEQIGFVHQLKKERQENLLVMVGR